MLGKKEWFKLKKVGYGIAPITWQGWVYVVVGIAIITGFSVFGEYLGMSKNKIIIVTILLVAIFIIDSIQITQELKI